MSKPEPDSLSQRQYGLNVRVNDAFKTKVQFDDVKNEKENSAIDKFFKIDLAAKCRNVEYIMDVLKSWETLYTKRALKKCEWLYDDEYSEFINPDYLHNNIFPITSVRAKILILKTVVMNIRRADRAEAFFNYCMKIQMTDIALKCLLFTSEEFKLDLLLNQNKALLNKIILKKETYIRFIIGKSFALLEAYMKLIKINHDETIRKFIFLYPVNNVKYLDLIEEYVSYEHFFVKKFDSKFCKNVVRKYKDRVLSKPIFYIKIIPQDILLQNITIEDAKILITALLPSSADSFWECQFYHNRAKCYVDLIPHNEILEFIKQIFFAKYPEEEFETHQQFYMQGYYNFMTPEQQAVWASNQIKSDRQVLGVGNDYLWYRFINFEEAFKEIKKYVMVTKEPEQRAQMINTLVSSMRSDRELEILFKHYCDRHINEQKVQKICFFDCVITNQNVFEFDDECWNLFYSLLLSLEVYNENRNQEFHMELENYKTVMLFYHVLHKKVLPDELINFLLNDFTPSTQLIQQYLEKLDKTKQQFLFRYLHEYYTNKIKEFREELYSYHIKSKAERYSHVLVKLTSVFSLYDEKNQRTPIISQPRRKHRKVNHSLTQELKINDKNYVIEKIPELRRDIKNWPNIESNRFLKKISIYFKDDISESLVNMCLSKLENEIPAKSSTEAETKGCVYVIFELGNEDVKVNLMKKYAPENAKIEFDKVPTHQIDAQKAICQYASKSLPPIPLTDILVYMKGDYLRYCLQIFNIYIAALPSSKCINLVECVLDTPVSIQKHALRLAFQCFSPDCLKNISMEIWKKTKNVSLRSVIYKALFNRIVEKQETVLYDILILLTLDLHDDDLKIVFRLVLVECRSLPENIIVKFKKAAWQAINSFKDREPNITRKTRVIRGIRSHVCLINSTDEEFVRDIIDEHVVAMFGQDKLHLYYSKEDIAILYSEKWNLTADFIANAVCQNKQRDDLELAKRILQKCLEKWNDISLHSGEYIYQRCWWEFVSNLNRKSLDCIQTLTPDCIIPIYESILDTLDSALPLYEMYMKYLEIELIIANRKVVKEHKQNFANAEKNLVISESTTNLGKKIGKLISKYVENKKYFGSFSEKIGFAVSKRVEELVKVILAPSDDYKTYINSALISTSIGLLEFETMETYLLAVSLLPYDERTSEKYQFVIDTVMKFPDLEVQSSAHQKSLKSNVKYKPHDLRSRVNDTTSKRTKPRQRRWHRK